MSFESWLLAIRCLTAMASRQGPVCVILHSTQDEIRLVRSESGHAEIMATAVAAGAHIVLAAEFMNAKRSFRDNIHLNAAG